MQKRRSDSTVGVGEMPPITTHVLDTSSGKPAANLRIVLEKCTQEPQEDGGEFSWEPVNETMTNADGRSPEISAGLTIEPSVYRCLFFTQEYFNAVGTATFYPRVEVMFRIMDVDSHYHIPLLLSPYGYSTYRGS